MPLLLHMLIADEGVIFMVGILDDYDSVGSAGLLSEINTQPWGRICVDSPTEYLT